MDKITVESKKMEGGFLIPEATQYPTSRWQSFKQCYFPYWLLRIFPAKTITIHWADIIKLDLAIQSIESEGIKQFMKEEASRIDKMIMGE